MPIGLKLLFWGAVALCLIALLFVGTLILEKKAKADVIDVDTAIVFIADISGSMNTAEVEILRRSHAEALVSPEVQTAIADSMTGSIAVIYIEFGEIAAARTEWVRVSGREDALAVSDLIMSLPPGPSLGGGSTRIGAGLLAAVAAFDRLPYRAMRLVVDVVGDGPADDPASVMLATGDLIGRGATINAIPLMIDPNQGVEPYYASYIKNGPGSFLMPLTAIEQLPQAVREKIVLELY